MTELSPRDITMINAGRDLQRKEDAAAIIAAAHALVSAGRKRDAAVLLAAAEGIIREGKR